MTGENGEPGVRYLAQEMGPPTAEKDREFFCDECKARCTVGTDGIQEFGHRRDCSGRQTLTGRHMLDE